MHYMSRSSLNSSHFENILYYWLTANYDCGHSAGATARFLATVAVCHRVGIPAYTLKTGVFNNTPRCVLVHTKVCTIAHKGA